jgi:hypothetical protein
MDNDDVLRSEDVATVRSAVLKTRRRVLGAAVVTPILAAVFVWLVVYYVKFHNVAASTFVAAIFLLLGVPVFVHWWRHYRTILRQLDLVAQRVSSGEIVYGSKVAFHYYK